MPGTPNNNHESRISVLEANHETLKECLTAIRAELHGLREDMRRISERLIERADAHDSCSDEWRPTVERAISSHEERLAKLEDQMRESKTFRRQFRLAITWLLGVSSALAVYWITEAMRRR